MQVTIMPIGKAFTMGTSGNITVTASLENWMDLNTMVPNDPTLTATTLKQLSAASLAAGAMAATAVITSLV